MTFKKIISCFLSVVLILPILASCKREGEATVQKELEKFIRKDSLSSELRKDAEELLVLHKDAAKALRVMPRLKKLPQKDDLPLDKAIKLHEVNSQTAMNIINQQKAIIKSLADNVKKLSRISYETQGGVQVISQSETLTLFNLLSLRDLSAALANNVLMIMAKFDRPYFDNVEGNADIKQYLLTSYVDALSIHAITANDLKTTLKHLREMKDEGVLNSDIEKTISKVVRQIGGSEKLTRQEINGFLKESITDKAQDALSKAVTDYQEKIKGKTFLFNPELQDHPLIHVLVIVSNLTWGLVNTLVGLGFVITAAILAPITQVAGATIRAFGYEPLFMEMRLPKLRIADNNMQIYADVCGLGIVPGKMSAGLFELDFCTWESFASSHEGGHAKQSAILGPLYFPAAILSYILVGGHGGFIEEWADAWATT